MESQEKSRLILALLAVQHRLRKGAAAQISWVHKVTSESPDAASATGKVSMRSGSPRAVVWILLEAVVTQRFLC